jgi:hypothetical protein
LQGRFLFFFLLILFSSADLLQQQVNGDKLISMNCRIFEYPNRWEEEKVKNGSWQWQWQWWSKRQINKKNSNKTRKHEFLTTAEKYKKLVIVELFTVVFLISYWKEEQENLQLSHRSNNPHPQSQ